MLNPHLYLNEKVFDETIDQKPTRDGFGEGLVSLGETDPNVVALSADLNRTMSQIFSGAVKLGNFQWLISPKT